MKSNEEFRKLVDEKYNSLKINSIRKRNKTISLISALMVCVIVMSVFISNGGFKDFMNPQTTESTLENTSSVISDNGTSGADSNPNENVSGTQSNPNDETSHGGTFSDDESSHGGTSSDDDSSVDIINPLTPDDHPNIKGTVNLMAAFKQQTDDIDIWYYEDRDTIDGVTDFAFELFANSYSNGQNTVISPISVMYAMGMMTNGANGQTLAQLEQELCGTDTGRLNEFMLAYSSLLGEYRSTEAYVNNSVWYNEDVTVYKEFLQTNADYYNADAYKTIMSNPDTLDDINEWISDNTKGLIENGLDRLDPKTKMLIINTIYFKAKWSDTMNELGERTFTNSNGDEIKVNMLAGGADDYLENDYCYGIEKRYEGGFSFIALMPKNNLSIKNVLDSLNSETYKALYSDKLYDVTLNIPEFEVSFKADMNDAVKKSGVTEIFSDGENDFSKMCIINGGDVYVSKISHAVSFSLDKNGTLAAASTIIEFPPDGANPDYFESKHVVFDQPFVYMVVDNYTGVPMFIGTVEDF